MIYSITEIEARYAETDKMGVIYHGNYATWFEVARLDYISKLGFSYADMEKQGIISPVTDLNVNYKKSIFIQKKLKLKLGLKNIRDYVQCINMRFLMKKVNLQLQVPQNWFVLKKILLSLYGWIVISLIGMKPIAKCKRSIMKGKQ